MAALPRYAEVMPMFHARSRLRAISCFAAAIDTPLLPPISASSRRFHADFRRLMPPPGLMPPMPAAAASDAAFAKRQLFASAAAAIAAAGGFAAMLLASARHARCRRFAACDAPDAPLPRCLPPRRARQRRRTAFALVFAPPSRFSHSLHHDHAMPHATQPQPLPV
jgi:hypothetical protein